VALGSDDKVVRLWDVATGEERQKEASYVQGCVKDCFLYRRKQFGHHIGQLGLLIVEDCRTRALQTHERYKAVDCPSSKYTA
jgi:hypothetical protein